MKASTTEKKTRPNSRTTSRSPTTKKKGLQTTKYDVHDLDRYSIKELRIMKEAAIAQLDFDESTRIGYAISNRNSDHSFDFITRAISELELYATTIFNDHDALIQRLENETKDAENKIREQIENQTSQMRTAHLKKLTTIETDRAVSLLREAQRPVALQIEFEEKAKTLARSDEIEAAFGMKKKAAEAREVELERRKNEINDRFDKLVINALNLFEREINITQKRLHDSIDSLWSKFDENRNSERKKVAALIRGAPMKILNSEMAKLEDRAKLKPRSSEFLQKLNESIEAKIISEAKTYIFDGKAE